MTSYHNYNYVTKTSLIVSPEIPIQNIQLQPQFGIGFVNLVVNH